jgi:uncharacterized membrane protein YedE/YeeE
VTREKLGALAIGVVFGFWLAWTRFVSYDVILGALLLKQIYLWLMLPSAIATGFIGLRLLRAVGGQTWTAQPITWSTSAITKDHVIGAALFGLGWAFSGTCPGPAIAQIACGQLSGLFTVSGIMIGVAAGTYVKERTLAAAAVAS